MSASFYKVSAEAEQNQLLKLSDKNYLLIYGFYTEKNEDNEDFSFNYRKNYDHKPTTEELKHDIEKLINERTDKSILNDFTWNSKPVYLSSENQFNFKAAYDLAVQLEGANLPIRFKLGENSDETPVYHTFTVLSAFTDFYTRAIAFVNACIDAGWKEKDSIDYSQFITDDE